MEFVLIAVFGTCAALCFFSVALLSGSFLTRRLKLPNDPPMDAFFAAPAPALVKQAEPEQAKIIADQQQAIQAHLDQGKFLCEHALQCQQDFSALESYGKERTDAEQKAWKQLKPIHKRIADIPEQFEAWHKSDGLLAHQDEIAALFKKHEADCKAAAEIIQALPPPNKARLYLLIAGLIIACLLLLIVQIYIANGPITASP